MTGRDEVDDLLALARRHPMRPSDDLMARVLADGLAEMPRAATGRATPRPEAGWLARLADLFGGAGALAGMGGAALAGLVLGVVQPAPVTDLAWVLTGAQSVQVDLLPSADALMGD